MKKKVSPYIDCELCRHFSGSSLFFRFGCAKGYTDKDPDHAYGLQRKSCEEFDRLPRAELIFARRKSILSGGDAMRNDAATVKRTATTLRKLLGEDALGQYLSTSEIEHFRAVIRALDALAPDLTRAAKLGDAHQAKQIMEGKKRIDERMLALVAKSCPDMDGSALIALVEDLYRFARNWRGSQHAGGGQAALPAIHIHSSDEIMRTLAAYKAAPDGAKEHVLRVRIGELLETLLFADQQLEPGGWRHFQEYRRYLKLERQMLEQQGGEPATDS